MFPSLGQRCDYNRCIAVNYIFMTLASQTEVQKCFNLFFAYRKFVGIWITAPDMNVNRPVMNHCRLLVTHCTMANPATFKQNWERWIWSCRRVHLYFYLRYREQSTWKQGCPGEGGASQAPSGVHGSSCISLPGHSNKTEVVAPISCTCQMCPLGFQESLWDRDLIPCAWAQPRCFALPASASKCGTMKLKASCEIWHRWFKSHHNMNLEQRLGQHHFPMQMFP